MTVFRDLTHSLPRHIYCFWRHAGRLLYGQEHLCIIIIFTVAGFWDHPWMLRISLITGRISFATSSGDLCSVDALALKCLITWDQIMPALGAPSTGPTLGDHGIMLTLQFFSFMQVKTVTSLCCDGLMLGSHQPFHLSFADKGIYYNLIIL